MWRAMASQKRKKRKKNAYADPTAPGALDGLRHYARARGLTRAQARQTLQKELAYTLNRPPRRRFQMAPWWCSISTNNGWQPSGDATLLARQPGCALPVDGGGRLVQVRLGATPETQDRRQGGPSLPEYRGRRTTPPDLAD